jgi:hypothetical protein
MKLSNEQIFTAVNWWYEKIKEKAPWWYYLGTNINVVVQEEGSVNDTEIKIPRIPELYTFRRSLCYLLELANLKHKISRDMLYYHKNDPSTGVIHFLLHTSCMTEEDIPFDSIEMMFLNEDVYVSVNDSDFELIPKFEFKKE